MDFRISEDQAALAAAIRSLCTGRFPLERLRELEWAEQAVSPEVWAALGEAGVFSLGVPETDGGLGLGLADAVVVFEELGRALVPGPLVGTYLAAGIVEGAAEGKTMVSVHGSADTGEGPGAIPIVVEHLAGAAGLLVLPSPWHTAAVCVVDRVELRAERIAKALDPLTPLWRIRGPLPAGRSIGDTSAGAKRAREATVLTAALQVGSAAACADLAVSYAKERSQFGRPIGSFQAVKHMCADMLVRAEVARCAVHAAAVISDEPDVAAAEGDVHGHSADDAVRRAVAGAKLLADRAAITNARVAVQVHGGMGFTWEVPVHLYVKRAQVHAASFLAGADAAETVAGLL